jgi:TM2 domain-containing membrane protein YozV
VWGLWHGVGLAICASYARLPLLGAGLARVFNKEPLAGWTLTQIYAGIGWLVFFYPVADAWRMTGQLFTR